jgi:hypothetical protein
VPACLLDISAASTHRTPARSLNRQDVGAIGCHIQRDPIRITCPRQNLSSVSVGALCGELAQTIGCAESQEAVRVLNDAARLLPAQADVAGEEDADVCLRISQRWPQIAPFRSNGVRAEKRCAAVSVKFYTRADTQ